MGILIRNIDTRLLNSGVVRTRQLGVATAGLHLLEGRGYKGHSLPPLEFIKSYVICIQLDFPSLISWNFNLVPSTSTVLHVHPQLDVTHGGSPR